jgi:hypothetical protein
MHVVRPRWAKYWARYPRVGRRGSVTVCRHRRPNVERCGPARAQPAQPRRHQNALSLQIIPACAFIRCASAGRRLGPQVRSAVPPAHVPKVPSASRPWPVSKAGTRPTGVGTLSAGSSRLIYHADIGFAWLGRVLDEIFARAEPSPGARISQSLKLPQPDTAEMRLDAISTASTRIPRYVYCAGFGLTRADRVLSEIFAEVGSGARGYRHGRDSSGWRGQDAVERRRRDISTKPEVHITHHAWSGAGRTRSGRDIRESRLGCAGDDTGEIPQVDTTKTQPSGAGAIST